MAEAFDINTIVLGYDGSAGSEKAADLALSLGRKYGATIVVCHAFGRTPVTLDSGEVKGMLDPVVQRLQGAGVSAEISIPDELPADGILRAAEERHADLIVVGSRGRGTFADLLLGSTAERVIRFAKVPVVVAR